MGLTMSRIHDESCRLPDDGTPQGLGRGGSGLGWLWVMDPGADQPDPVSTIEKKTLIRIRPFSKKGSDPTYYNAFYKF